MVKVTGGKKTKKCGILFGSRPLGRGPRSSFFSVAVLGARASASSTVGKSAHVVYEEGDATQSGLRRTLLNIFWSA